MNLAEQYDNLMESMSGDVYHSTSYVNAIKILQEKRFKLSNAIANDVEKLFIKGQRFYFMSVARTATNQFLNMDSESDTAVTFVLDSNWFNRRYKSTPTNYFAGTHMNAGNIKDYTGHDYQRREFENRILSPEPHIDFPYSIIKEIHINVPSKNYEWVADEYSRKKLANAIAVTRIAKQNNITLYVYEKNREYMKKNQAVKEPGKYLKNLYDQISKRINHAREKEKNDPWAIPQPKDYGASAYNRKSPDPAKFWRELYYKNDFEKLTETARTHVVLMLRDKDSRDFYIQELKSGISKVKHLTPDKQPSVHKTMALIRKLGFNDIEPFTKSLIAKWEKIKHEWDVKNGVADIEYLPPDAYNNKIQTYYKKKAKSQETTFGKTLKSIQFEEVEIPQSGVAQSRANMPQVHELEEFLTFLQVQGIHYTHTVAAPRELKSSQFDHSVDKIKTLIKTDSDNPIIISKDNFVIDGHHRWLASLNVNSNKYIRAIKLDLGMFDSIMVMKNYEQSLTPVNVSESVNIIKGLSRRRLYPK